MTNKLCKPSVLHKSSAGFTIIELLIATTVFSVILLLCTTGLIVIGRTYYKGITAAQTQETTRAIMDDISRNIQFKGGDIQTPAGTPNRFCIGDKRYSYLIGQQLSDNPSGSEQSRNVLVSDDYSGTCDAQDLSAPTPPVGRELMSPNMRLDRLLVEDIGNGLYAVEVRVIYGEADLSPSGACVGGAGGQFCAASELRTVVKQRVK